MKESEISIWNKISKDGKIEKEVHPSAKDSLFFISRYDNYTAEKEPYHVLKSSIRIEGKQYSVQFRINLIEANDLIISIAILFSIIIILLLTGLYIITKRLSIKLWKPFYETLSQIEQFELDKDKIPHFNPTSIEEFDRLNKDISKLIKKNSSIFKSQREFVENAAHELQTPLAIFQLTIDTLIQNPAITDEQFTLVNQLNETIGRLNRLNKSLLLLSKIDGNQFETNEKTDLYALIDKQITFFLEQASFKNIKIFSSIDKNIFVHCNSELMEILVSNLFLNTIKHNKSNGTVQVTLTNTSLTFCNTGVAISLDSEKLYQRFSKLNPSTHGNGLGLSIIKKIVELNDWAIKYSFKGDLHSFEIIF